MTAVKGALWLADGSVFRGWLLGAAALTAGEVVFNTAMTGYQEILTDPSYFGQIVVFTYPLIGNYGTADTWQESRRSWVQGMVARHAERQPSHEGPVAALDAYLRAQGKTALIGVDTRALTQRLRVAGTMNGALGPLESDPQEVAAAIAGVDLTDSVYRVSIDRPYTVPPKPGTAPAGRAPHVAVLDYGLKRSIVEELTARGARVTVLPASSGPDAVDAVRPDGVVLSNGPGDPAAVPELLPTVRHVIDRYPVLGICLGHQLVALAEGGHTFRLKFGHHGANHPLLDERSGKVIITSQNHGYAVDAEAIRDRYRVRFRNLHDGTVEGLEHRGRPVLTVQHHPEAGPGPKDSLYLFDEFMRWLGADPHPAGERGASAHA